MSKKRQSETLIHELAVNAFKEHVIDVKHNDGMYRHFRCGKTARCEYYFNIVTWPGVLAINGDLGEMMWERTTDMLVWSKSAINSIGYFAEKVPHCMPTKGYSTDRAAEVLQEKIDELEGEAGAMDVCPDCDGTGVVDPDEADSLACSRCEGSGRAHVFDEEENAEREAKVEKLEDLKRQAENGEISEEHLYEAWGDLFDGDYDVNFKDWTSNFLWCRECVLWFLENYKESESAKANPEKANEGLEDAKKHGVCGETDKVGEPLQAG